MSSRPTSGWARDASQPVATDATAPGGSMPDGAERPRRVSPTAKPTPARHYRLLEAALVAALALGTRLVFLDHVPHKDELNHVLAARSLLATGTLDLVPGGAPYDRAWAFTYLMGGMFRLFGESLVVARLPALLAAVALIVALFLWVRSEGGRVGGWVAALLLIFSPIGIQLSQWARFYTIHALLFFGACMLVYSVLTTPALRPSTVAVRIGAAILALALAFHLQVTTVVGVGGLLLWVTFMSVSRLLRRFPEPRQRGWLVAAALTLAVLAVTLLVVSGVAEWALARARYADSWAEENRNNVRFYHYILLEQYPPLWTLFPLAVLLAAASRLRAALLCTCVFGVAFVAHSLLAWKTERYLFYALPFFFGLWGIAIGGALPWLRDRFHVLLSRITVRAPTVQVEKALFTAFLLGVALFAAVGSAATSYSIKLLTVGDADWQWGSYRGNPNWVAAAHALGPIVQEADVVVASYDVSALYGLGRVDYFLRRPNPSASESAEFTIYWRIPVPVISTPESLARVMSCQPSGLAVIERVHWRKEVFVPTETVDYLEAHATPIPLPEGWRLYAYSWTGRGEKAGSERCASLLPSAE